MSCHEEAQITPNTFEGMAILIEKISQSLAGRTAVLRLLPFSLNEIHPIRMFEQYEDYLELVPEDKEVAIWVADVKRRVGK